jgi:steroid delta-isomerase-like uncharacterized protein
LTGHNLAALDEIFHADYVEDEPPPGMGPGREGLRQWLARWIAAFPDVRWTVEEQIADQDRVWSRSIWQGTHRGSFLGIPPTGKNVAVAAWTIDRLTDGKIAESRTTPAAARTHCPIPPAVTHAWALAHGAHES